MKRKFEKNNLIEELYFIVDKRAKSQDKGSYTKKLLKLGSKKIAKKIGEEATELIIDYLNGSNKRVVEETADLIYHIVVMLYSKKISVKKIERELIKRRLNVR
tara:strand:+ start:277 stop:585 length:309 start_codon:yes stop_codon:yes gene_type:complete